MHFQYYGFLWRKRVEGSHTSCFELWKVNGRHGVVNFVVLPSTQRLKEVECREEQDVL